MRILVTGGIGFIGYHTVEALLTRGHSVRILTHGTSDALGERVEIIQGDFADTSKLAKVLIGVDCVVHLAWSTVPHSTTGSPTFDLQTNVVGSINLLDECRRQGIRRFVFISSGGVVYGPSSLVPIPESHQELPISVYGITKLTVEKYLNLYNRIYGQDYVILRLANAYGERQNIAKGQGVVGVWLKRIQRGETIQILGDGTVVRDYLYVKDAADAICLAVEHEAAMPGVYNIGSGIGLSLNDILSIIREELSLGFEVEYFPARKFDVPSNVLNIERARRELLWSPRVDFSDGIRRVWKWIQAT